MHCRHRFALTILMLLFGAASCFAQGYSPGDTNQTDVQGHYVGPEEVRETTPLHLAAERGHRLLVERFLCELDAHRGRA